MDKNGEKKGINLMPEDLRSKESSILSKVKNKAEFDFDFVSPDKATQKKEKASGASLWSKLKKVFNKPKKFGDSLDKPKQEPKKDKGRPKIIYNPNKKKKDKVEDKKVKTTLHIPDKEAKKPINNFTIDYKDGVLGGIKDDKKDVLSKTSVKDETKPKSVEKVKKSSFLDKLKAFFASKPKAPKVGKPIIAQEIKEIKKTKSDQLPKLDKDKIKAIPELKDSKPKTFKVEEKASEPVKPEETKTSDFSIPIIPGLQDQKLPPVKNEASKSKKDAPRGDAGKKQVLSKFHQPQPRIRAKLLDNGGGVDLIPAAARTRSWGQIINLLLTAILGSAFIVGIFYGFLFFQVKNVELQKNTRSDQITTLEKKILDYEDLNNDISQLGDEIKAVHKLLSFHLYWTNFFQLLEKYTVGEIYYSGLAAGNSGAITLQAVGRDFDSVARQIKVLQQEEALEFVVSADVSAAQYNKANANVEFDITLVLNPLLFTYNPDYIYHPEGGHPLGDESDNEEEGGEE